MPIFLLTNMWIHCLNDIFLNACIKIFIAFQKLCYEFKSVLKPSKTSNIFLCNTVHVKNSNIKSL